jgi:hypothetical protein
VAQVSFFVENNADESQDLALVIRALDIFSELEAKVENFDVSFQLKSLSIGRIQLEFVSFATFEPEYLL